MWWDNIKIQIKIGWEGVEKILLSKDRNKWRAVANAVMNFPVP